MGKNERDSMCCVIVFFFRRLVSCKRCKMLWPNKSNGQEVYVEENYSIMEAAVYSHQRIEYDYYYDIIRG